jgi:hypothetical protein
MNISVLFASGLAATLAASVAIVLYLRQPLEHLLTELCGNEHRAEFWTAFSAVTVGLVPVIFALGYRPVMDSGTSALLEVAEQLKWGLVGIVMSVLVLGWVVSRFIPIHAIQLAGGIQVAIIAANIRLPGRLQVRKHLATVPQFIRQIFYVHWFYIVLVLGGFSAICLGFAPQLAGGTGLGRFLSGFLALLWLSRLALQWLYYDREVRRANRVLDAAYVVALAMLVVIFVHAVFWPVV